MSSWGTQKSHHYMAPNTIQFLPKYTNQEQDYIRECFSSVSYKNIQQLPNEIKYNYVNETRANQIDNNITSNGHVGTVLLNKPSGPYFQSFPYMSTPYNMVDEITKQEAHDHKDKTATISEVPWLPSHANPRTAFNPPPPRFEQHNVGLQPDQFYSDPYEDGDDVALRNKWYEQSRVLNGPFIPGGKTEHGSHFRKTNRQDLDDILSRLKSILSRDWGDCKHDVYVDADQFVIEFSLSTVMSVQGLLSYMNMMISTNPFISQSGLSKIPELWNHCRENSVVYALKPHWVRKTNTHSYYVKHPHLATLKSEVEYKRTLKREEEELANASSTSASTTSSYSQLFLSNNGSLNNQSYYRPQHNPSTTQQSSLSNTGRLVLE